MSTPESPGSKLRESVNEASRQIESILDAAEQAAVEIRAQAQADADAEAQRARAESVAAMSDVTAPLVQRIENLRVEAAALTHEIEAAAVRLRDLTGPRSLADLAASPEIAEVPSPALAVAPAAEEPAPPEAPEPPPPARPSPAFAAKSKDGPRLPLGGSSPMPVAYPGRGAAAPSPAAEPAPAPAVPEEALLRATQMAVGGSSREEIERTLSDEFGLEDASPVVDDILGP